MVAAELFMSDDKSTMSPHKEVSHLHRKWTSKHGRI